MNTIEPWNGAAATNDQRAPPSRVRKRLPRPGAVLEVARIQPFSAVENDGTCGPTPPGRNDEGCAPVCSETTGAERQLFPASHEKRSLFPYPAFALTYSQIRSTPNDEMPSTSLSRIGLRRNTGGVIVTQCAPSSTVSYTPS